MFSTLTKKQTNKLKNKKKTKYFFAKKNEFRSHKNHIEFTVMCPVINETKKQRQRHKNTDNAELKYSFENKNIFKIIKTISIKLKLINRLS